MIQALRALSVTLTVVLAMLNVPAATAAGEQPIVIKFSHAVPADTPKGLAAIKFKEFAEARTAGRVQVEIHPDGELYQDSEEVAALRIGAVQMIAPSLSKFSPIGVHDFEAFELPYLFADLTQVHRVTEGAIGQELFQKLQPFGIRGLAYWDGGFKIFTARRPLIRPDDLAGLRMRVQPSVILEMQMKLLGALPRAMSFAVAADAIKDNLVDGTENPPSNLYARKMYLHQKYGTLTYHGYLGYAVIVNNEFWQSLPPEIRTILEGAMADATKYADSICQSMNESALAAMRETGLIQFHKPTAEEHAAWIAATAPAYKDAERRVGRDLIDRMRAAAAGAGG